MGLLPTTGASAQTFDTLNFVPGIPTIWRLLRRDTLAERPQARYFEMLRHVIHLDTLAQDTSQGRTLQEIPYLRILQARLYCQLGESAQAVATLDRLAGELILREDSIYSFQLPMLRGNIQQRAGNSLSALYDYRIAFNHAPPLTRQALEAQRAMVNVLIRQYQYPEANSLLDSAFKVANHMRDSTMLAYFELLRAKVYEKTDKPILARDALYRALHSTHFREDSTAMLQAHILFVSIYEKLQQNDLEDLHVREVEKRTLTASDLGTSYEAMLWMLDWFARHGREAQGRTFFSRYRMRDTTPDRIAQFEPALVRMLAQQSQYDKDSRMAVAGMWFYRDLMDSLYRLQAGRISQDRSLLLDRQQQRFARLRELEGIREQRSAEKYAKRRRYYVFLTIATLLLLIGQSMYFRARYRHRMRVQVSRIAAKRSALKDDLTTQRGCLQEEQQRTTRNALIIEQSQTVLHERARRMENDLLFVRNVQLMLQPPAEEIAAHYPESFLLFSPRDAVSADCYWHTEQGGRSLAVVIDCAGHGVPGAMVSLMALSLLRRTVVEWGNTDPGTILQVMHHQLQTSSPSSLDIQSGLYSLDIAVVAYEPATHSLLCAAAGSCVVMLYEQCELSIFKGHPMRVGSLSREGFYATTRVQLHGRSVVYLSTDGYRSQMNQNGRMLGSRTLRETITAHGMDPLQNQRDSLQQALREHQGNVPQTDDICLIGIAYNQGEKEG